MKTFRPCPGLMCGAVLLTATSLSPALSPADFAIQLTATVQTNPAAITLSWMGDTNSLDYYVYRRLKNDVSWGTGTALPGWATNYVDTNVFVGGSWEYSIYRDTATYYAEGYIYAGIRADMIETRGKMILVVDQTFAASLSLELARLQQDLVGDGWTVLRHDVPRMAVDPADVSPAVWTARANEVANLKALIKADYDADPANVKAVFLFGHVPVPYSGDLNPDGVAEHKGAWPADVFYGAMSGAWTDSTVTNTSANDPRNWNVPGDGKFDSSQVPAVVDLAVGRVDFANLPAFPQGESELLRQYLNKDHNFRQGQMSVQRRGLIDDNLGVVGQEAFAANGWRNFAPFFGPSNILAGDWLNVPAGQSFLWAYGCGAGSYTNASGVASTLNLVTNDTPFVFTMLYGAWFGDWDSPNNLLRAQLATAGYSLACAWAGRPNWYFPDMGLGETIGFSARLNQNGAYGYSPGLWGMHVALLGDPSLRMHPVAPPSGLAVATNGSGGMDLTWSPSPDAVVGYHVYRASSAAGPFTRLTTSPLTQTTFTDLGPTTSVYMVRALKLEETPSGSYYNLSQGAFPSPAGPAPRLTITAAIDGSKIITGDDTLGRVHRIQFVPDPGLTNWQTLGTATGGPSGTFQYIDSTAAPPRFYRSAYP